MPSYCEICHDELTPPVRPDGECESCGEWSDYWSQLSPADKAAEIRSMDAHVDEQTREGRRERCKSCRGQGCEVCV